MKAHFVNAFVEGTVETFDTMCGLKPERKGSLQLKSSVIHTYEMFSTIGLSGPFRAAFVLTMDQPVALGVISAFVGEETTELDDDAFDAMGELINIIAGAAAAKFEGKPIDLSLPTVMLGQKRLQYASTVAPWLVVPMQFTDIGPFNIELSLIEEKAKG